MIRRFIRWNEKIVVGIEKRLKYVHRNMKVQALYSETIAKLLEEHPDRLVIDIGAGKSCPFMEYLDAKKSYRIIGVDVCRDEIILNSDLRHKLVADVQAHLPFRDGSVDMIVSRSVLEHLRHQDVFVSEANRILAPGGMFIHLLPSRFALFAVINQILPHKLSRRVLYFFWPDVKGVCGFPAFYDRCYASAMRSLLKEKGFDCIELRTCYYQAC